jgi:hypothetical protein
MGTKARSRATAAPQLIVPMSLRLTIPRRVALQCLAQEMGQNAEGTGCDNHLPRSDGRRPALQWCSREPVRPVWPRVAWSKSGDASLPTRADEAIPIGRVPISTTWTAALALHLTEEFLVTQTNQQKQTGHAASVAPQRGRHRYRRYGNLRRCPFRSRSGASSHVRHFHSGSPCAGRLATTMRHSDSRQVCQFDFVSMEGFTPSRYAQ